MAVASMFFDTLNLANRQIDSTSRDTKLAKMLFAHARIFALNLVARGLFHWGLHRFHRDTVMLKGLAAEVSERRARCVRGEDLNDYSSAVKALERVGKTALDLHGLALRVPSKSVRVQASAKAFAAGASDLYDAISNLRWEFLELEASASPLAEGYVAHSPEEVDKLFERIASE